MSSSHQQECAGAGDEEPSPSLFKPNDMVLRLCSKMSAERLHWEETKLLPFFTDKLLIDTFATHRLRLAILEAKFEYLQRRCRDTLWPPSEGAATRHIAPQHAKAAIERWMDISIPRWVEEEVHREIGAFCGELTAEGGGATLRGVVEEILAE